MIELNVAARAAEIGEDEEVVEVPIDGVVYQARRLTLMQSAQLATARTTGIGIVNVLWQLIEGMLGTEAREHLERLVWERRIDLDDFIGGSEQNPKGLIDQIQEHFTGHPTKPSTGSSSSQAATGRKSTVRSRGKGSIQSDSPSADS